MLRVVKVGGSLLDWPLLPKALTRWLAEQSAGTSVLICGGGKLVDQMRERFRLVGGSDEAADRSAIRFMCRNVWSLARHLGRLKVISDYDDLSTKIKRRRSRQILVFDAETLLGAREAKLNARDLPRDWTVTSDSIAAWLAELLEADELVLLKSASRPAGGFKELAAAGYVDDFFPQAAERLNAVRFVNLRANAADGRMA